MQSRKKQTNETQTRETYVSCKQHIPVRKVILSTMSVYGNIRSNFKASTYQISGGSTLLHTKFTRENRQFAFRLVGTVNRCSPN